MLITVQMNKPPAQSQSYDLHPAAKEASITYSEALKERDRLRMQVQQLANDLEVERRHCNELQHTVDREREARSYFERYAVEVNTHLDLIASSAIKARERSMDMAKKQEAKSQLGPPITPEQMESEIENMVKHVDTISKELKQ